MTPDAAVPLLTARVTEHTSAGRRVLVLIDGLTGSGKSTLAGRLEAGLPGCLSLAVEELVPGWQALEEGVGRCAAALRELAGQGRATVRSWDWGRMEPGGTRRLTLDRAGAAVVEGCGALAAGAQPLAGAQVIRVLVEAEDAVRHRRLRSRDPYTWDVAVWEAQERRVASAWRRDPRYGPDVVVRPVVPGPGVR